MVTCVTLLPPSLPSGYELERKDSPGEFVNLTSLLSSQGTMDFMLVRNIREYFVLVAVDHVTCCRKIIDVRRGK